MKKILLIIISMTLFSTFGRADEMYVCNFSEPLQKVNAKDWNLKLEEPHGDGTACVTKVLCRWNPKQLPPSAWSKDFPPSYEEAVACSKDSDGQCRKAFKACSEDPTVNFITETVAKQKLNVQDRSAEGVR